MLMGCHAGLQDPANVTPECAPLLHQVTGEEEETVRAITPHDQYVEHFDGYLDR